MRLEHYPEPDVLRAAHNPSGAIAPAPDAANWLPLRTCGKEVAKCCQVNLTADEYAKERMSIRIVNARLPACQVNTRQADGCRERTQDQRRAAKIRSVGSRLRSCNRLPHEAVAGKPSQRDMSRS